MVQTQEVKRLKFQVQRLKAKLATAKSGAADDESLILVKLRHEAKLATAKSG